MRTVDSAVTAAMDASRVVNARLTLRDERLVFYEFDINSSDTAVAGSMFSYDADRLATGAILQVANVGDVLYWRHVANPQSTPTSFGAWNNSGLLLQPNSRPAVYDTRIFYQRDEVLDANYMYVDYVGPGLGTPVVWKSGVAPAAEPVSFAPVSTNECYTLWRLYSGGTEDVYWGYITHWEVSTATATTWGGRIYGPDQYSRLFDAVRQGTKDYVFFADSNERRAVYTVKEGPWWADVRPVTPLDVVDDTSLFKVTAVGLINNRVTATGILKRTNGPKMHVYSFLTDHGWTFGRDMYIGNSSVDPEVHSSVTFPALGGKFHLGTTNLHYIGVGVHYMATASYLVGVDTAALKTTTQALNSLIVRQTNGTPLTADMDVLSTLSHAALRTGASCEVEVAYDGNYAKLATLELDAVADNLREAGEDKQLAGRGRALRRLSQWQSDASYDYWSQTKLNTNPATLTKVIRTSGLWDTDGSGDLILEELNTSGELQLVAKACRGHQVAAQFYKPAATEYQPRMGLILNMSRETRRLAGERQGVNPDTVASGSLYNEGIYVVWGETEHSGGPGVKVYYRFSGAEDSTGSSASLVIPDNTWFWLKAVFQDGRIWVYYRLDSSSFWSRIDSNWNFAMIDQVPWPRDELGRAGLLVENNTTNSPSYNFGSRDSVIPVQNVNSFPTSETVVVDFEQINYNGKSPNRSLVTDLNWAEGYTWQGANHQNTYLPHTFTGYEIYIDTAGSATDPSYYNDCALVVLSGPGAGRAFKVTDYDYIAPDQWVDTGGPYTLPETWQDHVGDLAYGNWAASNMRRVFVEENPAGVLGENSRMRIYPALLVAAGGRGAGGTIATGHGSGVPVGIYRDVSVATRRVQYASLDQDISLAEMIGEIAAKAGVLTYSTDKRVPTTINEPSAGWHLQADHDNYGQAQPHCIIKFNDTASSGFYVGVMTYNLSGSSVNDGRVILLQDNGSIGLFSVTGGGVPSNMQLVDLPYVPSTSDINSIKFSIQEQDGTWYYACWINDRHIHTFMDETGGWTHTTIVCASAHVLTEVDWPQADRRVDNYILDMGSRGSQLINQLIGEKRVFFNDDQNGGLRVFQDRVTVNAGAPYVLAVQGATSAADFELATRVRVEGGEIYEVADYDLLQTYGNIFALINSQELNTEQQSQDEATLILADLERGLTRVQLSGAADPRIEPNDIIEVTLPSGTAQYIVDGVGFRLALGDRDVVLDMDVEARDA